MEKLSPGLKRLSSDEQKAIEQRIKNMIDRTEIPKPKIVGNLPIYNSGKYPEILKIGHVITFDMSFDQIKSMVIRQRLEHFEGNITATADSLKLSPKTIYTWMHEEKLFDKYTVKAPYRRHK